MTRFRFHFPRRLVLVLAALTAGLALTASAAAAATAGTPSPSPTASVTAPVVTPSPSPSFGFFLLRPQRFIVHADTGTGLNAGSVFASGPVRGIGTRLQVSATDDTWTLTGPTGTVRVLHSPVGAPVVDPATCTGTLDATGRWALIGLTGSDRRAFGFGVFRVRIVEILSRGLFGRCLVRARPQWVDLQVLGTGRAAILRFGVRHPALTPALTPAA